MNQSSQDEAARAMNGDTVSVGKTVAISRISNYFVMRDIWGNVKIVPDTTDLPELARLWHSFRTEALNRTTP